MIRPFAAGLFVLSLVTLAACGQEPASDATPPEVVSASGTILEVVKGDEGLSKLAQAIAAAQITGTLSAAGPYTLFAPTDEAFAKLGDGALDAMSTPTLTRMLTNHLVDGEIDAAALIEAIEEAGEGGYTITTLGGGTLVATRQEGAVVLTDAKGGQAMVLATDVEGSNGLVHLIDGVLMPQ